MENYKSRNMKIGHLCGYAIFVVLLFSGAAMAEEMLLDFNAGSGMDWPGWTWFDDVSGFGQPGWRLDSDGPLSGGQDYAWGYGPRSANKGRNDQHGSTDLAMIDTADRAPSTSAGGSFYVYEPENYGVDTHRAGWWVWYDGEPLSQKGITNDSTNRWEFYLKTQSSSSALTYDDEGGIDSVSSQTFHIGTYVCWNDGWPSWGTGEGCPYEGPGNQHYYHYLGINPGAWINVQLDQHPQHRRGTHVIGNNPTSIDDVCGALDEDVDPDLDDDTFNEPIADGIPDGKNYMAHLHRWYMELTNAVSEPTAMWIDEMKFYSTQDTPEPDQNEESITSLWVGYWVNEDYWEIGWQDMSWTDADGSHTGDHAHSTFEVRWSTAPITNANYNQADIIEPMFFGGVAHAGEANLIRRPNSWRTNAWTRFQLPDDIEQNNNRIYFAVKDVSVAGGHIGTQWPWNRGDGHDAPTAYVRTIDYYMRPDVSGLDAEFIAARRTVAAGQSVQFADTSAGRPTSWEWNFGDNSAISNEQHPQHTYQSAGTYTVSLTVTNAVGSITETKSNYITVTASGDDSGSGDSSENSGTDSSGNGGSPDSGGSSGCFIESLF